MTLLFLVAMLFGAAGIVLLVIADKERRRRRGHGDRAGEKRFIFGIVALAFALACGLFSLLWLYGDAIAIR